MKREKRKKYQGAKTQSDYKAQVHLERWRVSTADDIMHSNTLFFLLIVSGLSLVLAQGTYDDCCLWYVEKISPKVQMHAVDYRWQVTDGGCNIPAVIFIMRRGQIFCADPKERWVVQLRKRIDKKKAQSKTRAKKHRHRRL